MGIVKEPDGIDFVVDSRPLTKEEEEAISEFIRVDKEKRKQKELRKKRTVKSSGLTNFSTHIGK